VGVLLVWAALSGLLGCLTGSLLAKPTERLLSLDAWLLRAAGLRFLLETGSPGWAETKSMLGSTCSPSALTLSLHQVFLCCR
jgi:hypothetical protein